jgi:putative heme iron utilization protein
MSTRSKENDQWTEMIEWKKTTTKIKIKDSNSESVQSILKIKGPVKLKLKLYKDGIDTTKDENGNESIRINAKDQNGDNCYVIFLEKDKKVYMVVYYTNLNIIYKVKEN